jgi:hypothetical protein
MSEANQTANPTDAREASMSRVTTLDDLLPKQSSEPASEATEQTDKDAPAKDGEDGKPAKKGINERITQLVAQRKEAEAQAETAKREAEELRARLEALSVKADPIITSQPKRADFASQEEYEEAMVDWKVDQRIAARERAQAEAQAQAEARKVETAWATRCEAIKKEVEDFVSAIEGCEEPVSPVVSDALKRSEVGPQLLYFFAKHPQELKKVNVLHPIEAVRYISRLEMDLAGDEPVKQVKPVERSKAPAPITPVRQTAAADPGKAEDFATYRARRQAEKRK